MAESAETIGAVKRGIEAASGALNSYNKMIDKPIPWSTFSRAIEELKDNEEQYSREAAIMVGKIQTLFLNSSDQHSSSQVEVTRWCKMAVPLLGRYISLFEHVKDSGVVEAQNQLLLAVLNEGAIQLNNAMTKLTDSRTSFNSANEELKKLQTQLEIDFEEGSTYYEKAVSKLRTDAYSGAASGLVLGPIGLSASYAVAAGVVEGDRIPKMKTAFEETKRKFSVLQETVERAQESIDSAKLSITAEIDVIGVMSAQIKETKSVSDNFALVPAQLYDDLKKSAAELSDMCKDYIKGSESHTLNFQRVLRPH